MAVSAVVAVVMVVVAVAAVVSYRLCLCSSIVCAVPVGVRDLVELAVVCSLCTLATVVKRTDARRGPCRARPAGLSPCRWESRGAYRAPAAAVRYSTEEYSVVQYS